MLLVSPLHVIQEVLRHAELATTELYSHCDLEEQLAAADKMDELLAGSWDDGYPLSSQ